MKSGLEGCFLGKKHPSRCLEALFLNPKHPSRYLEPPFPQPNIPSRYLEPLRLRAEHPSRHLETLGPPSKHPSRYLEAPFSPPRPHPQPLSPAACDFVRSLSFVLHRLGEGSRMTSPPTPLPSGVRFCALVVLSPASPGRGEPDVCLGIFVQFGARKWTTPHT